MDLDGDGSLDLAVTNVNPGTVVVLLNNGTASFGPPSSYSVGTGPNFVFPADLDGDGSADLLIANSESENVTVLWNNGAGSFIDGVSYDVGNVPRAAIAADLDGDGDLDLVATNIIRVLRGLNTGDNAIISRIELISITL